SLNGLPQFEAALVMAAGFWLLISLLLRCGLFPLMGWVGEMAISPRDVVWLIGFPLGMGLYLLLQWHPLLTNAAEQRTLTAGLAALSTLLLGVMAFTRKTRAKRIIRVAGALMAFVWLGLSAFPPAAPQMAAF